MRNINLVNIPKKKLKRNELVTFAKEDMQGVEFYHSNAIVNTVNIWGIELKRIFLDNGSSFDILSANKCMKNEISEDEY